MEARARHAAGRTARRAPSQRGRRDLSWLPLAVAIWVLSLATIPGAVLIHRALTPPPTAVENAAETSQDDLEPVDSTAPSLPTGLPAPVAADPGAVVAEADADADAVDAVDADALEADAANAGPVAPAQPSGRAAASPSELPKPVPAPSTTLEHRPSTAASSGRTTPPAPVTATSTARSPNATATTTTPAATTSSTATMIPPSDIDTDTAAADCAECVSPD